MPQMHTPGVYLPEITTPPPPVEVPTSITAFVGRTVRGPVHEPVEVNNWADYEATFGGLDEASGVSWQVRAYFDNGGAQALVTRLVSSAGETAPLGLGDWLGDQAAKTGLYALEKAARFNILCMPPDTLEGDTPPVVCQAAAEYCVRRNAMLIIDPPVKWQADEERGALSAISHNDLGVFSIDAARNSAVYFPRVQAVDPRDGVTVLTLPSSGYLAGVWARNDVQFGVWTAPAGVRATLSGLSGLAARLTDDENAVLNPLAINALRDMINHGPLVWGARTLRGTDQLVDDYKYIPVRRLALHMMNWARANTGWAAFEANDAALWSQLRLQFETWMSGLWRQGALVGTQAADSFAVHCDASTTTPEDIDAGVANVQIAFAPVKPAEFLMLTIQVTTAKD